MLGLSFVPGMGSAGVLVAELGIDGYHRAVLRHERTFQIFKSS